MSSLNWRTVESRSDASREIVGTRVFDAPRLLVWKMWSDPQHIAQWWGPQGFTNTIYEMDFRPGGLWRFVMHGSDGTDYQNKIIYREIVMPEIIVYSHVSGPAFDATVTFQEQGEKTAVTMRARFESAQLPERVANEFGAVEGMHQTLARLGERLEKVKAGTLPLVPSPRLMEATPEEFVISRVFEAPRELVWKAWTESDRLAQWFGPKGVKVVHSANDLRPGGVYHYAMQLPDGKVMWGKWVYREIVERERLVFVTSFSDENGGVTRHPLAPDWPLEMLSTITFDDEQGRTRITIRWTPINATEPERKTFETGRDGIVAGWTGTFEQLETYLANA